MKPRKSRVTPVRTITEEYTFVQLKRQDDLTRRIQEKRSKAAKRAKKVVEMPK